MAFEGESVFKFELRRTSLDMSLRGWGRRKEEYSYFRIVTDFKICRHYFRKSQEQYVVTAKLHFHNSENARGLSFNILI